MAEMQVFDEDGYVLNFASETEEEERDFYVQTFPIVDSVVKSHLHCTSCNLHIGAALACESTLHLHPVLRVALCSTCHAFYKSIDFNKDKDGTELCCRWCGQGGQVVYPCSKCPYVFCKKCVVQNLPLQDVDLIECNKFWDCFNCSPKIIWTLRAIHWAHSNYLQKMRKKLLDQPINEADFYETMHVDPTICCGENKKAKSFMTTTRNMKRRHSIDGSNRVIAKEDSAAEPMLQLPEKKKPKLMSPNKETAKEDYVAEQKKKPQKKSAVHNEPLQQLQKMQFRGTNRRRNRQKNRRMKRQRIQQIEDHLHLAQLQYNRTGSQPMQKYPKNALGKARTGLEFQVLSTQDVCKETIHKLNALMLSNAYKNVRNHNDVKDLHIHISDLQNFTIGHFKMLNESNQADMKKLNVAIDAENYVSDDDDLQIVENTQVLIDLVSEPEKQSQSDPVVSSSSSISTSLDQANADAVQPATLCISDESGADDIDFPLPIRSEPECVNDGEAN